MKITKDIVTKLIRILSYGIKGGAGSMNAPGQFCVQQAVSKAIGLPDLEDQPSFCVSHRLIRLGILLNDMDGWRSNRERAMGLRRLSVAELGTSDEQLVGSDGIITAKKFNEEFMAYFRKLHPGAAMPPVSSAEGVITYWAIGSQERLMEVAEIAVQVLKKSGTPGSKFLFLAGPSPVKLSKPIAEPKKRTLRKFESPRMQTYASKLADPKRTLATGKSTVAA